MFAHTHFWASCPGYCPSIQTQRHLSKTLTRWSNFFVILLTSSRYSATNNNYVIWCNGCTESHVLAQEDFEESVQFFETVVLDFDLAPFLVLALDANLRLQVSLQAFFEVSQR